MTNPGSGETVTNPDQGHGNTQSEIYRNLAAEAPKYQDRLPELVPSIHEHLKRGGLTGTFTYDPGTEANMQRSAANPESNVTMSEGEGLEQLQSFLEKFAETGQRGDEADIKLAAQAADLAKNLTYIGSPELEHATEAIAGGWKDYLDQNPEASLYLRAERYKSSQYILDRALGHFSDDDLAKYSGRLHFVEELRGYVPPGQARPQLPPEHKVVMLDDWVGTGRQMSNAYAQEIDILPTADDQPPNVEVQLVVADQKRLEEGLPVGTMMGTREVPVSAAYLARPNVNGEPAITGLHSSTDDSFEMPIAEMVTSLHEKHGQPDAVMPPLTNIDRPYRQPGFTVPNIDRMKKAYGVTGPSDMY